MKTKRKIINSLAAAAGGGVGGGQGGEVRNISAQFCKLLSVTVASWPKYQLSHSLLLRVSPCVVQLIMFLCFDTSRKTVSGNRQKWMQCIEAGSHPRASFSPVICLLVLLSAV
jgi:hypothetical protein